MTEDKIQTAIRYGLACLRSLPPRFSSSHFLNAAGIEPTKGNAVRIARPLKARGCVRISTSISGKTVRLWLNPHSAEDYIDDGLDLI